jgi:hypothetical protein
VFQRDTTIEVVGVAGVHDELIARAIADYTPLQYVAPVAVWVMLLVVPALLLANALAAWPGRRAAPWRIAQVPRTELLMHPLTFFCTRTKRCTSNSVTTAPNSRRTRRRSATAS